MFLKRLTLKGFKSFAEPTTLEFEPGITVVVGPNGSGKSNVVDAVAWVLGAQGPRTVRSSKMEDVIFAGTAQRPALGRAEVSLTIDNSSGMLPIGLTEVTVTRTLWRSGESEYALNGAPCRLLDVQELLSDSGVGRQQHVIVSQGQLDGVLNARPEDRRLIVEEAAGVLKYRRRRERTERRLAATESDLDRLQDLLREVRRQIRPLERQAEAARRRDAVAAEHRSLRSYLAGRDLAEAKARIEAAEAAGADLETRGRELRRRLAGLDEQVEAAEGAVSANRVDDLNLVIGRLEGLRERGRGLAALITERRRSIERSLAAAIDAGVVASLEAEASKVGRELAVADAGAETLAPALATLGSEEQALDADRAAAEAALATQAPAASEGQLALEGLAALPQPGRAPPGRGRESAAELRGRLGALRRSLERDRDERARLEATVAGLEEAEGRLAEESGSHRAEMADAEVAERPIVEDLEAAERRRATADTELQAARDRVREAESDHRAWRTRAEALTMALEEVRARGGAQHLGGATGLLGTLAELVEVDQGWEAAFEAAAGDAVASVVLRGVAEAAAALERLAEDGVSGTVLAAGPPPGTGGTPNPADPSPGAGAGGALNPAHPSPEAGGTLHRVDPSPEAGGALHRADPSPEAGGALHPSEPSPGAAGTPAEGAGALLDHVRAAEPAVGGLIRNLLARVIVVEGDWRQALDRFLERAGTVVVTRAGDRFGPDGWRIGDPGPGATGAALAEAVTLADRAADSLAMARESEARATVALETARSDEARLTRALDDNDTRLGAAADALQRVETERSRLHTELAGVCLRRDEVGSKVGEAETEVAELERRLSMAEAAEAAVAEWIQRAQEARQAFDERATTLRARRRDLEVQVAGVEERRSLLRRRLSELEDRLERTVQARQEVGARREGLERTVAATVRLGSVVESCLDRLEAKLSTLGQEREARLAVLEEGARSRERLRQERVTAEAALAEVRERAQRAELQRAELRLRHEGVEEAIRRDLDMEPDDVVGLPCPDLPPDVSASQRARDLDQELRLLGPVNPLAVAELEALEERARFLEGQLDDVRAARRELAKVIRAIDAEIVAVFSAAYADVARHFSDLVATLFPGGTGALSLTEPDNPLETGIEISARPAGKHVRKLSLLSGGERSLVALAYLCAVFRSRPSPFYLMDEVEAALDDVNLHRFLNLVREFRADAQLVIVSHQSRTMEIGDCLYGVSLQPGGSSRVVSERATATA